MNDERKPIILLVEDDPLIFRLISFHLEREGFEVGHVDDGQKAMAEFDRSELPDLILLDVMLPYHSGYDLLAHLRSLERWANVPVIMLASNDREDHVVKGLSSGANDVLAKPFRPAEVVARVRNLLETAAKATQ